MKTSYIEILFLQGFKRRYNRYVLQSVLNKGITLFTAFIVMGVFY